jgi:hypothetical protein
MSLRVPLAGLFLGTVAAFNFASPASALGTHTLFANLSGSQEVPANGSLGQGLCTVTMDDVTGAVSVTGNYSGLSTSATLAHIHGLAPPGSNAGIIVSLTPSGGTSGTVSGSGSLTPAQVTGMLAGNTYVNIHTTSLPAGEIRGQITTAVPSMPWSYVAGFTMLALAGCAFVLRRRTTLSAA